MRVLGDSVRARYLEQLDRAAAPPAQAFDSSEEEWPDEIDGLPVVFPRDGYRGDYIEDLAQELRTQHGDALADSGQPDGPENAFRKIAEETMAQVRRAMNMVPRIRQEVQFEPRRPIDLDLDL